MRLRLEDFAVFIANWNDKATNLRRIAAELNIGLDSLVLVDDNPAERSLVRRLVPEVDVIDLPEDPAGYRRCLADYLRFETVALTEEDLQRTEQYRAQRDAGALASASPGPSVRDRSRLPPGEGGPSRKYTRTSCSRAGNSSSATTPSR